MISLLKNCSVTSESVEKSSARALAQLLKRVDIGFFKAPERETLCTVSAKRASEIKKYFSKMGVLGIGGSSLGARALLQGLNFQGVEFFENVDAIDFWQRLEKLKDLKDYHWVIVSKSGTTLETLAQANFLHQYLGEKKLSLAKSCTVVTEIKESPLSKWAQENSVTALEIPLDVGGRFSVLTPVGFLPAAFCGVDLNHLIKGAQRALKSPELVTDLVGVSLDSFQRKENITLFWTYSNRLKDFGLWVQQLWSESLGKPDVQVSTPIPMIGANDQHSVLQQIIEGEKNKFVWFLRVLDAESYGPNLKQDIFGNQSHLVGKNLGDVLSAEQKATEKALRQHNIASLTLTVNELNAESLAFLFMLFELVVASLGEALNINAFDQPGVELGKRLATEILKNQR